MLNRFLRLYLSKARREKRSCSMVNYCARIGFDLLTVSLTLPLISGRKRFRLPNFPIRKSAANGSACLSSLSCLSRHSREREKISSRNVSRRTKHEWKRGREGHCVLCRARSKNPASRLIASRCGTECCPSRLRCAEILFGLFCAALRMPKKF